MTSQAAPEAPAICKFPHSQGMAKIRKPNSPSPDSPGPAGPAPAAAGDADAAAGDSPVFAAGNLPVRRTSGPAPASSPSVADGEITLEEHEDRQQQRPRLPDQRREKKSFEMGAVPMPSAKESPGPESSDVSRHGAAVPSSCDAEPVPVDEIETYDLHASEAAAAPGVALSKPAPKPVVDIPATPGLDDLEEFIARTATEGRATDKPAKIHRPFTLVEKICSAAGLAILILAAVWLTTSITSEADGQRDASTPWPDLPLEGSLVTISEASSSWRKRKDTDRVAQMSVALPVPGQQMPEIIPQVEFTIDADKSTSGYLRFIIKDSEGKSRGDTRVVQIENGKLKDMGKGEIIKGATEGAIYGSYGLLNTGAYRSYEGDDGARWSVEVAESASYNADDKDWQVLGTFDVRNDFRE